MPMSSTVELTLDQIFTEYPVFTYEAGEVIVQEGAELPGVFYLKEGIVATMVMTSAGQESMLNLFRPVSFFPLTWAVNKQPNTFSFVAVTKVKAYLVPPEIVVDTLHKYPDVLWDVTKRLLSGMSGMLATMEVILIGDATQRVARVFWQLTQRFGNRNLRSGKVVLDLPITHAQLAALTGLTRETVTRNLKHLQDQGILSRLPKRRWQVDDVKSLEKAAQKA